MENAGYVIVYVLIRICFCEILIGCNILAIFKAKKRFAKYYIVSVCN